MPSSHPSSTYLLPQLCCVSNAFLPFCLFYAVSYLLPPQVLPLSCLHLMSTPTKFLHYVSTDLPHELPTIFGVPPFNAHPLLHPCRLPWPVPSCTATGCPRTTSLWSRKSCESMCRLASRCSTRKSWMFLWYCSMKFWTTCSVLTGYSNRAKYGGWSRWSVGVGEGGGKEGVTQRCWLLLCATLQTERGGNGQDMYVQ